MVGDGYCQSACYVSSFPTTMETAIIPTALPVAPTATSEMDNAILHVTFTLVTTTMETAIIPTALPVAPTVTSEMDNAILLVTFTIVTTTMETAVPTTMTTTPTSAVISRMNFVKLPKNYLASPCLVRT